MIKNEDRDQGSYLLHYQIKILDSASDKFSLDIKEAIYIKQLQPSLNNRNLSLLDIGAFFHNKLS